MEEARFRHAPTTSAARLAAEIQAQSEGRADNGNAKILVVDDNNGIPKRPSVADKPGYGLSRRRWCRSTCVLERTDDVDLLFTDVVMPGDLAGARWPTKQPATAWPQGALRPGYFEGALWAAPDTDVQFLPSLP